MTAKKILITMIVILMCIIFAIVFNSCTTTKPTPAPIPTIYRVVRITSVNKDGTKNILYQSQIR